MPFTPLIQIEGTYTSKHKQVYASGHRSAKKRTLNDVLDEADEIKSAIDKKMVGKRGCEYCPLNKTEGVHKIKGKVKGKKIFVWAQSPGAQENRKRKELVGPSGKFLWYELKKIGLSRHDVDIQNVVRCWPVDINTKVYPPYKMRSPNKAEIKCCSLYTDEAIEKSKAKLHLVFGQMAAAAVLRKEYRKDQRIFYSDQLRGWVVVLDHPSYFIRQGYQAGDHKQANASLQRFRDDLQKAKQLLNQGSFDRYGFLKKQKYIGVTSSEQSNYIYRKLKKKAKQGYRLIADMEEGKVNEKGEPDENGNSVALCCGFAYKPGTSYVFALEAPNSGISEQCKRLNVRHVRRLLSSSRISKGFHYGISDTDAVKRLLRTTIRKFDYDTFLASYFADPNAKKYGLAAIAASKYPEFLDYKSIEAPDAFTPEFKKLLEDKKYAKLGLAKQINLARSKRNALNLARMPWKTMVLYNGADCHLETLIERDTKKDVNQPLMQVYIDASYILHRMEKDKRCQPLFDYRWHKKIEKLFVLRQRRLRKTVCKMAGKYAYIPAQKDRKQWLDWMQGNDERPPLRELAFKPKSNDHILWLLFVKLKYKFKPKKKDDKPNTRAATLLTLGLKHKKANIVVRYRQTNKAKETYTDGFKACAKLNHGHLRTNWKTTGTGTGRLSSGRDKDKKNDAVVNLQNVHGDELIQCLLISDRRWRKLYKYWIKYGNFDKRTWKKFSKLYVDLGFDFSQNELRELAEESGDKALIHAFATKEMWYCRKCKIKHKSDPHVEVGHDLTGWDKEEIAHNDHVRKLVKNMQFGLVFGLQGEGLFNFVTMLGVKTTREEVDKYHAKYFKKYKGVKKLQEKLIAFARKHGYIVNMFGFKRKLVVEDQVYEEGKKKGAYWANQAINTPIQGAAHQLLMMALAALFRYPKKYKLLQFPTKEIHDALYFRVRLDRLFRAIKQGLKLMLYEPVKIVKEDFKLKKKVPLSAKPKCGFRFGVEIEFEDKIKNEYQFLNAWCKANKELEDTYKLQISEDLSTFLHRKELEI